MKRLNFWFLAGAILIIVGLYLSLPQYLDSLRSAAVPKVSASPFTTKLPKTAVTQPVDTAIIQGEPVRLRLPGLGIDLPVIDGYYNATNNTWTLTKDKVQYAVRTPLANNTGGNTFLYGHNRKGVFKDLARIKLGDEAIINTDNGHEFIYLFKGALETTPSDDSLFGYQGPPILTIQTCSGAWYQNRQLFTFQLKVAR